ncbi:hypothetical protein cypCar_00038351 [Cyprinus carpio]|nr:hypothetical protein cypCar_00038351 [Cyprinus carpio]
MLCSSATVEFRAALDRGLCAQDNTLKSLTLSLPRKKPSPSPVTFRSRAGANLSSSTKSLLPCRPNPSSRLNQYSTDHRPAPELTITATGETQQPASRLTNHSTGEQTCSRTTNHAQAEDTQPAPDDQSQHRETTCSRLGPITAQRRHRPAQMTNHSTDSCQPLKVSCLQGKPSPPLPPKKLMLYSSSAAPLSFAPYSHPSNRIIDELQKALALAVQRLDRCVSSNHPSHPLDCIMQRINIGFDNHSVCMLSTENSCCSHHRTAVHHEICQQHTHDIQ